MRTLLLLFILLLLVFVVSALAAVPVYLLVQNVADVPFKTIISDLCSLSGLVLVFLFLKYKGCLNRQVSGFATGNTSLTRDIMTGFGAGIGIMLVLELMLLGLDVHQPEPDLDVSLHTLAILFIKGVFAGLGVGLIEETIFRGALLGGLRTMTGTLSAVFATSVVYAGVHFIKFPALPPGAEIHWYTGFSVLSDSFARFAKPVFVDMFLALSAFGFLLALVRMNKGNIYQCIGIHAGVVFSMKLISHLTDYNPDGSFLFLVNKIDRLLGYLAFVLLVILTIAYHFLVRRKSPPGNA